MCKFTVAFDLLDPDTLKHNAGEFSRFVAPENIIPASDSSAPLLSRKRLLELVETSTTPYLVLVLGKDKIELAPDFEKECINTFQNQDTGMVYSGAEYHSGNLTTQPLIDYQSGSVRDDFDFGRIIVFSTDKLRLTVQLYPELIPENDAAFYGLRLALSLKTSITRIDKLLYRVFQLNPQRSGTTLFTYVDPKNVNYQQDLEAVFTEYAKRASFFLPPATATIDPNEGEFPVQASVIIPVRNREKTIADAVRSALSQETSFAFNVLVVDNHSSDKTTSILEDLSAANEKLIHIIPQSKTLLIGGCWNEAINHPLCGRFSIQLDSDDIYNDQFVLEKIVRAFYQQRVAAVVGSYTLVNFDLREIPPGLIDHKEWTENNGHNNALRIHGFGAPRAFYTPLLRKIQFPNVSYGEDYAVMLQITRTHRLGRIYDSLYFCRRWEDNSDAAPSVEKMNRFNSYKDSLRSTEITKRKELNLQR